MTDIDYDALLADYGQAMYDEGCYEAAHNHVLAKEARSRASSELAQLYAAIRALRAALAESERDAGRFKHLVANGVGWSCGSPHLTRHDSALRDINKTRAEIDKAMAAETG